MIQTCSNSILKQVPLPRCPRQKGQSPDPFPRPLRSQKETSRHQEHRNKNYKDLKQTMHKWNRNLRHLFAKICCKVQKVSSATLLNTMVLQRKCPAFGKSLIEALSFLVFFWPWRSAKFQPCFKDFQDWGSIPFAFVPMPIPKPSPVHVRFQVSSKEPKRKGKRWDTHLERWECVSVHLLWGICTCFRKTCRCHLTILQPGQTKKPLWRTRMSICIS